MNNVLHICSYYIGNKLYKYLFKSLEPELTRQLVYVPIRNEDLRDVNFFESDKTIIIYDNFLKKHHKFFYGSKIKLQKKRLNSYLNKKNLTLSNFDIIHAHTLFTDGGTAYLLNKEYDIPYIVSVRNTDINSFYKYALHYRRFSHKILINAKTIIFISHAYRDILFSLLPKNLVNKIEDKCLVIPNGIDGIYLDKTHINKKINSKLRLFTSASLDKNKNIITVLKLVKLLKDKGIDVNYRIAGKGEEINNLQDYIRKNNLAEQVSFVGYLLPEHLIKELDLCNIFILLSYKETFGISYVEALARGKPIIYTQEQGIDGYFPAGHVGYAVPPTDVEAAFKAIKAILRGYDEMANNCLNESKKFDWPSISKEHLQAYFD